MRDAPCFAPAQAIDKSLAAANAATESSYRPSRRSNAFSIAQFSQRVTHPKPWTQCWTQKNGLDSRSTEPGPFFCCWHPEIVENRWVRCELPSAQFERGPDPRFDRFGQHWRVRY